MSELVEKVALAIAIVMVERKRGSKVNIPPEDIAKAKAMSLAEVGDEARAAIAAVLEHLADNVSDEMVAEFRTSLDRFPANEWLPQIGYAKAISAALRAAAGSATPEVK